MSMEIQILFILKKSSNNSNEQSFVNEDGLI